MPNAGSVQHFYFQSVIGMLLIMTTTVLAHFDGKVFVPDEPVDVPIGTPLRVHVEAVTRDELDKSKKLLTPVIVGLDAALAQAIATDPTLATENM
jgi:hypothetical protein